MPHRARLLGFAFANADFLFEVDSDGIIQFAAGAANDLVKEGAETLVGAPVGRLFMPSEGSKFATFAMALRHGDRAGPYKLQLIGGTEVQVSMFRLPANGRNISCTISKPGRSFLPTTDAKTGLASRDSFLAAAASIAGPNDALTLVDVPGLTDLCATLSPDNAETLMARIGASIEKSGASASGRLSDTRFGALASATAALGLGKLVRAAIAEGGIAVPKVTESAMSLQGPGLSDEQRMLALRYVVEKFAEGGKLDLSSGDISASFATMMQETQTRLLAMTQTVGEGAFEMAYQPIADLATGQVSHYEALARFDNKQGTGESVKFIEALGIADAFDLVVAAKILSLIENDPRTHYQVAFNISGHTLASPASFGLLAGILAKKRKLAPRLLIEITETAAITDLAAAGKAVAVLREMGYRVGLDDFGAGAASVNYLHAFPVDFVKFDGAMIQKIGTSPRDDALLSGLAKLCAELGVGTIAEWVEDEAMAKAVQKLGFRQGQGRWLGAPLLEIPDCQVAPGKRKGVKESWG